MKIKKINKLAQNKSKDVLVEDIELLEFYIKEILTPIFKEWKIPEILFNPLNDKLRNERIEEYLNYDINKGRMKS